MSEKFKGKYRVQSNRLQGYDYAQEGAYFVTICTKNKEHFFGKVKDGKMELSEMGKIAEQEWIKTPEIRKNVQLDAFVVMPNHIHGIILIRHYDYDSTTSQPLVETHCNASLQGRQMCEYKNTFGPQSNNLSAIIRGFKGTITKQIHEKEFIFAWQPSFHDHIIHNDEELNRIREYIQNNPQNWDTDEENPHS